MNQSIIDPKAKTETEQIHPWTLAIVFAEGDLALVAELENVTPAEITKFAIEHSEEITTAMYSAFKAKLITEMAGRLPDLSDGSILKLFDIVKGSPGFSVEVNEAASGEGNGPAQLPRFTINMGVKRASSDD